MKKSESQSQKSYVAPKLKITPIDEERHRAYKIPKGRETNKNDMENKT